MKPAKQYHHGSLRPALLDAARVQLARHGHEALSLRALAAALGVAPSAPYGHFKNREDLLAVLVAEGSADLAARYQAAAASPGSAIDRLELACLAYLSFAQDNPALFTLMFTNIDWEDGLRARVARAMVAYGMFEKLMAATMPGDDPIDINAATVATWSAIHGMSLLKLNGRLERRYVSGQTDLNVIRTVLKRTAGAPVETAAS